MTTSVLYATADTYVDSQAAASNFGTGVNNIYIGDNNVSGHPSRALVQFDLSSIPVGAVCSAASLAGYANTDYANNARTWRVHRLKVDWVETQATYNNRKTATAWTSGGGYNSTDLDLTELGNKSMSASEALNEYKTANFDAYGIAELQKMWNGTYTNNGFYIKNDTETADAYLYNTREGSNAFMLTIVWDVPGAYPVSVTPYMMA